jgi:hypothetical protein
MTNTLEDMRARLRDQLADTEDETWNAGEKDDVLLWAVRKLNQRLNKPIDPEAAAASITLATGDYFYAIDSSITQLVRVDYIDSDSSEQGPLTTGWEIVGDLIDGTAKLHVSPTIVEQGGTLRLIAYGRYTLTTQTAAQTNAVPDDYVTLVLALSRAEAYRRLVSNRARFEQWQVSNQVQNISVNELLQMVSEADRQAEDEWMSLKRWQKPVMGRI